MVFLDAERRPRPSLAPTGDGAGAIEFLRADGAVGQRLVPEEPVTGVVARAGL